VSCGKLFQSSEKAQLQWKLEGEFSEFEQRQSSMATAPAANVRSAKKAQ
jgi:hypothetical protein